MIVATANAQETMNIITNALKTTSTIGIQVCPAEVVDSTSTVTVEEGPIQTPEFCDFAGQYNAPMCAYYYPQGNNGVRHISTGTDFVPDYMNYQADMEQYATYDYGQQTDISIPMDNYSNALPMTRSFGTTMDDFMARSRESDFDMLRDIETQTIGEPFWKS